MLDPHPFDVTVFNPKIETDRLNDQVLDWSTADEFRERADIQQVDATELIEGRTATVEVLHGFFCCDSKITARSRVRHDGVTYEVTGTPNRLRYGTRLDQVEVRLRRVAG